MTNAEKFIDLVAKLYNLSEKAVGTMSGNIPEIDAELSKYNWNDIKSKTQLYFSRKNDKTRPTIAQILALLETDPNVQPCVIEPQYDDDAEWKKPTTRIWSITHTFNKLVDILLAAGVIPDADGKFTTNRSLVDPRTDQIILNPMQWLQWELECAKNERPDIFAKFPNAKPLEQIALAIQNNLIMFKVRDWAKLAQRKEAQ